MGLGGQERGLLNISREPTVSGISRLSHLALKVGNTSILQMQNVGVRQRGYLGSHTNSEWGVQIQTQDHLAPMLGLLLVSSSAKQVEG